MHGTSLLGFTFNYKVTLYSLEKTLINIKSNAQSKSVSLTLFDEKKLISLLNKTG